MFHRRTSVSWTVAVVSTIFLSTNSAPAQQQEEHHKTDSKEAKKALVLPNCPVMDAPVDFSVKSMTPDGPVYFCCKGCIKKFEADPAKYEKQVADQRVLLAKLPKIQVTCPVSGKPVDEKVFIEKDGAKILFCCKGCVEKYQKEPGKFSARLADSYSYQTRCPIMNEEIDPTSFIKLKTGQTIYFCCQGCDKKFLKDPAKYAPVLEAQGTHIDPKKMEIASDPKTKTESKSKS